MKRKHNGMTAVTFLMLGILVVSVFLEGCEPLRKKFTRKKKKERTEETEVPVLEPIEYPAKAYSPQAEYKKFYSLWRVWVKELSNGLDGNALKKRKVYMMNQAITSLAGMQSLLPAEKQGGLEKDIKKLQQMLKDFESPVMTRNISSWQNELRSIEKDVGHYTFQDVEGFLR